MAGMDREPKVNNPNLAWLVISILFLFCILAIWCHFHPDSQLTHSLRRHYQY